MRPDQAYAVVKFRAPKTVLNHIDFPVDWARMIKVSRKSYRDTMRDAIKFDRPYPSTDFR